MNSLILSSLLLSLGGYVSCNDARRSPSTRMQRSPSPSPSGKMVECRRDNDCLDKLEDACSIATCEEQMCVITKKVCDDGDFCTIDMCRDGECMTTPRDCSDGDMCTIDSCKDGECVNTPVDCDDGDACTDDVCVDGECRSTPKDCSDGDMCTLDVCEDGVCSNPAKCDSGKFCTIDSCDAETGECSKEPRVCDDDNKCTIDKCNNKEKKCVHTHKKCDDGKHCTNDSCDYHTGECKHHKRHCPMLATMPNYKCFTAHCDEASGGKCVTKMKNCNDGNDCTRDVCKEGKCLNVFMRENMKDPKFAQACGPPKKVVAPKKGFSSTGIESLLALG